MKLAADTVTAEQIRALLAYLENFSTWGGGAGTRRLMIKHCNTALRHDGRLFKGARSRIADVLNAMEQPETLIACPRCAVGAGTRCTAMTHSGYKPLRSSHAERVHAWEHTAEP